MASYNIDDIKKKINQLSGVRGSKLNNEEKQKLQWFKPTLGQHSVRFLPYRHSDNNQPFAEISYYDNALLTQNRLVAPLQFGQEDPIFEALAQLKTDTSKEAWMVWRNLTTKPRYYAPILVRGEEAKGVQIWELSPKLANKVFQVLANPDYEGEDLFDPNTGFDFLVNVTPTDKTFKNNPVKEIEFSPRRKSTPLATTDAEIEKLLAAVPNLHAYFKAQVPSVETLSNALENFLAGNGAEEAEAKPTSSDEDIDFSDSKQSNAFKPKATKKAKTAIDEAFDEL
jgi:hypothetical protein